MRKIFDETVKAAGYHYPIVFGGYQGETWVNWREAVTTVTTIAHYDEALQVLVIDMACSDDEVPADRILATVDTEAGAIRRAVKAADQWRAGIAKTAPSNHPGFGLEGDALAAAEAKIIAEAKAAGRVRYPDL